MNDKEIQLIESGDGSHTLYIPSLNETYHSTHGAVAESVYVYLKNGLAEFDTSKKIKILEVGFGTGLNALLSLEYSVKYKSEIEYHTLEPFPLSKDVYSSLNHGTMLGLQSDFMSLHTCSFNTCVHFNNSQFQFTKYRTSIFDFDTTNTYQLIYFDAFAPSKQPEMWQKGVFEKLYKMLDRNGVLVTYCASGAFKRVLKECGFEVHTLAGPPGKKEMTKAIKTVNS